MTTGTRVSGFYGPVTVGATVQNLYRDYRTKTFTGSNYPSVKPTYEKIDTSYQSSYLVVRKGKSVVKIKYHNRFLMKRTKPPKRASVVEHPYWVSITAKSNAVFEYSNDLGVHWYPCSDNDVGGGGIVYSDPWDSNDDLAMIGKLREKVAGSDFNAGVFLAEGHEALKMITNAALRINGAYSAARKGNLSKARRILVNNSPRKNLGRKSVANNWLELQYGWLPLLKDVESGAQFLAHQHSVPLQHVVTARSSKKTGPVATPAPTSCKWGSALNASMAQVKAILKEKDVVALSGLTDPASVLWEKLPYSFVVDWFIPVGNYLNARGLSQSLTGTFVVTNTKRTMAMGLVGLNYLFRGNAGGAYVNNIVVNRTVNTTLPIPVPSIKPLAKTASWRHCANALALVLQLGR